MIHTGLYLGALWPIYVYIYIYIYIYIHIYIYIYIYIHIYIYIVYGQYMVHHPIQINNIQNKTDSDSL